MKRLTMHQAEIRQLRLDARRLEAVAKRLRIRAKDLAREEKLSQAAKDFFSKQSKVDPTIVLQPKPFLEEE